MRLINADALIEEIHSYTMYDEISKYDIERAIDEAQTVDAEPVRHGRWEFGKQHEDFVQVECSACGGWLLVKWHDDIDRYRYCPNCGAKMDEEVQ